MNPSKTYKQLIHTTISKLVAGELSSKGPLLTNGIYGKEKGMVLLVSDKSYSDTLSEYFHKVHRQSWNKTKITIMDNSYALKHIVQFMTPVSVIVIKYKYYHND